MKKDKQQMKDIFPCSLNICIQLFGERRNSFQA